MQGIHQDFMASKAEFVLETPKQVREPLALASYAGTYNDPWYGDVKLQLVDEELRIDFTHTELLKGRLEHYNGDTFVVRWDEPLLEADAFIDFDVSRDNAVQGARMEAVTDFTDFSFDFHNLRLERVEP